VQNVTVWYKNNASTLMLYLPFEGGSNSTYTKDYSGNDNDAIGYGEGWNVDEGPTWNRTGGKIGGGYLFNGSTYLYIPNSSSLTLNPYHMTIELWMKPRRLYASEPEQWT
jgi:hypothetical protein